MLGHQARSVGQFNSLAELRRRAVAGSGSGGKRCWHHRQCGGIHGEREARLPVGVGYGSAVAEKHFAFRTGWSLVTEYFDREAR